MSEIKGIPDRNYVSPVGDRRLIRTWIRAGKDLIDRSRIACRVVLLTLQNLGLCLAEGAAESHRTRTDSRGCGPQYRAAPHGIGSTRLWHARFLSSSLQVNGDSRTQ